MTGDGTHSFFAFFLHMYYNVKENFREIEKKMSPGGGYIRGKDEDYAYDSDSRRRKTGEKRD